MNGVQRLLGGEVGLCFLNEYVFKEKLHFLVTWKKVMCTQMLAIIWEMAQAQKFWLETIRKKNVLHHQLMHCFSFPFMLLTRPRDKGPAVIHLVRWVKSLRVIPVIWKKKNSISLSVWFLHHIFQIIVAFTWCSCILHVLIECSDPKIHNTVLLFINKCLVWYLKPVM